MKEYSNKLATEIMNQIKNGDYSGVDNLYLMFEDKMNKIIPNRHRSFTAYWSEDDHRQEVFATILEKNKQFDSTRAGFSTWLNLKEKEVYGKQVTEHKIVIKKEDEITGEVQKDYIPYTCPLIQINEDKEEVSIIDEEKYAALSAEDELITQMTMNGIYDELNSLPDDYKQSIYLQEFQDLKLAQAAEIMGYKPSVLSNKHSRALKKMKKYAEGEDLLDERYARDYHKKKRVMDEHDEPDL